MEKILGTLRKKLPDVRFAEGETFCWSPAQELVTYCQSSDDSQGKLSLLHEAAHALLGHAVYRNDLELLLMEVAAWEKACELAGEFDIAFDAECIQDRLDTYRDWLHERSTCPRCSTASLQVSTNEYRCHNCFASWHVSTSRFCRAYRLSARPNKKSPQIKSQATFR